MTYGFGTCDMQAGHDSVGAGASSPGYLNDDGMKGLLGSGPGRAFGRAKDAPTCCEPQGQD